MAIQRSLNLISQQRIDVPDLRSIESASRNDFDQLIQAFVTGTSQGYFVRGFNILMAGAIGGAASGLQMAVDPGAILHVTSSQSGTVLMVPTGTAPQALNSAINTIVDGAFAPSAINYVSIEYERFIDDSTSAQIYIWNPTTNNETTKNAPRAQILRYRIKITTATPAANFLPVAVIVTDSGNNVTSVTDARPLIGRLGRGGVSPNPFFEYSWPQGRIENPSTSTSNSVDPFSGGDKAINNLKDWMDSVMSSIQEIKGTTYWYSVNSSGSLESLREDLGNTVITGKGFISHGKLPNGAPTAAGQINWDQDINIRVIGSALTYKLVANPSSTDITLADDHAAYITLIRGVEVTPNLVFTNGLAQVASVGAISWTSPLAPGDYIKLGSDTDAGYYQILTVDSLTQVTLTTTYTGTSTGPVGAKAKYAFGSYHTSPAPSTSRDIFIATRELVPSGENIFWLFLRTDNGGASPKVYIRFLGSELDDGETEEISDNKSQETLRYIGAPLESSQSPQYVSALNPGSVPQITQLTVGNAASMASNQYFFINSSGNFRKYAVWVNKNGTGVQPIAPGVNAYIEWDISTGQTSTQTATALATALNNVPHTDFAAVGGVGLVTVTNTSAGTCGSAANFNVGAPFAVSVTQSGTGIGNFAIKDGDNLTLAIKELDEALGDLVLSLDDPTYDETVTIVTSGATPPTSLNGPLPASTVVTLPNNSRLGGTPAQFYTVGKGVLEVYLNGQYLTLGNSWAEVGTFNAVSNQVEILDVLKVGDVLEFRIDISGGGGGGGAEGPQGPPGPQGPAGLNSSAPVSISTKTSNYSVFSSDDALLADCTTGAVTFFLPAAGGINITGKRFTFKKIDSSANAMNIQGNLLETIDGLNIQTTTVQYTSFTIISNGTSWWII